MNINDIISREEDFKKEENIGKDILFLIKHSENELAKYAKEIKIINTLREEQDTLLVEYIEGVFQPKKLNPEIITYKGLFLYFKKNFIQHRKILKLDNFSKNGARGRQKEIFESFFGNEMEIHIDVKDTNFPHLIGYKDTSKDKYGQRNKNHNVEFLDKIFYQMKLIEDYEEHKCSLSKMSCISWISETLDRPTWILDRTCLTNKTKLKSDLLFIKRVKESDGSFSYHYVSLIKETPRESLLNKYIIDSHHKIDKEDVIGRNMKFNINKAIYKYDYLKK